jgi:hypothetical protein
MPEISQADLDALIARAAQNEPGTPAPTAPAEPPPDPTHVAILANGERYEYAGGHPSHVSVEGSSAPVAVTAVYPLPELTAEEKAQRDRDRADSETQPDHG